VNREQRDHFRAIVLHALALFPNLPSEVVANKLFDLMQALEALSVVTKQPAARVAAAPKMN
jgi:hypothetical protein